MKVSLLLLSAIAVSTHQVQGFCPSTGTTSCFAVANSRLTALAVDEELDSVEFPPPLSQIDRLQRSALFWSKALPIVANYYGLIGSLKLQELLGEELAEEKIEKLWAEKHEDGAQKLYQTVADLKGHKLFRVEKIYFQNNIRKL